MGIMEKRITVTSSPIFSFRLVFMDVFLVGE
jgi:hypothetical protein